MHRSFIIATLILIGAAPEQQNVPETVVTGVIATRVEFRGAARVKMVETTLDLLKSSAYSHQPTEGAMAEWAGSLKEVQA